ncbi:MAG: prepilin-type N-terminal cleavage/methylation domain-containing protein [Verrucomicrobiales bacterium]|jgi:prepilin-type N-terminal cleavage/methylation domain-containing protein
MQLSSFHRTRGFTLIEIVVSIFLVTLILGVATMSFKSMQDEGKLKTEGIALKLAARKLMREAVEKNRSYAMTLAPSFFAVGPTYSEAALEGSMSGLDPEEAMKQIRGERHQLENDIQLWVKRWNEPMFRVPRVPFERWVFEPGGICEPLSLRLTRGDSSMSMTFNPLTAHVEEESLIVPK